MIPWERYGMEVAGEAANGKDALELLRTTLVDLVFVDISMPVLNGIEMIKQAQQEFENIDYVVLSFHEDLSMCVTPCNWGAGLYL
jgi:two-component system response regulator YesN